MSDFTLYLDSVAFQDFEIPDSIKAGGAQSMLRHKYAGGVRTIDTMGPDDDDIPWSGTFMGGDSQARCKQLDIMRRQGQQVVLTFAGYQYLVTIESFRWDFQRTWQIPYTICLAVVQDLANPPQDAAANVDSQITSDAATATAGAGLVLDSTGALVPNPVGAVTPAVQASIQSGADGLNSAMADVNSTLSGVTSISNASVDVQSNLSDQVSTALTASQGLQTTLNSALSQASSGSAIASGTSAQNMISNLTNLSALSTATAQTATCSSVLGRMQTNLSLLGR